jgi:tRNA/rRNA methyltransferase/tRNA (cytidine32/uridine32-2'-O)-methyltransferase
LETKIAAHPVSQIQDFFRVILLEPKESLNIGSVARAMMNLGFQDLVLVSPLNFDTERAATTARRAKSLFNPAQIVSTLEQALASCTYVAGFSTKDSKNTPPVMLLEQWSQSLPKLCLPENAKIGLLFGPEDTGLRYEHLPVCNSIIRIPTCDDYDSLNLAQAALLVFYAIASKSIALEARSEESVATGQQLAALDALVQQISEKTEFENAGTPPNTIGLLKSLFRRPDLKHREMQILLGFFSRIAKSL